MAQFECAVVLAATLNEEQVQEQVELVKGWIGGLGAEVTAIDIWGRKRLAYSIRKQREGFYVIYYFTLEKGRERLVDLDRRFATAESVLRHLVVRLPALKEPPRVPKEEEVEVAEEGAPPQEKTALESEAATEEEVPAVEATAATAPPPPEPPAPGEQADENKPEPTGETTPEAAP